jgi:hypothetical protein
VSSILLISKLQWQNLFHKKVVENFPINIDDIVIYYVGKLETFLLFQVSIFFSIKL